MILQLKSNYNHIGVNEDGFNHLDQFFRKVPNTKASKLMK